MDQKLVISVCSFMIPEVAEVLRNGDYPDVLLNGFPGSCMADSINYDHIIDRSLASDVPVSEIAIIGSACHSVQFNHERNNGIKINRLKLGQCFDLLLNSEALNYFTQKGYYIVSNGWLRTYKRNIRKWGFAKEDAPKFFGESMKGILFLDTMLPGDYLPKLEALSKYMGLPYKIFPIGLSYCKMYIDSVVFKWRNEEKHNSLIKRIGEMSRNFADYSVIFSQLDQLVSLTNEHEIIEVGLELMKVLFAPSKVFYTSYKDEIENKYEIIGFSTNVLETEENSFRVEIFYREELLGVFAVYCIQFPEFLSQYKNMGKVISNIFGLLITNARKYEITLLQRDELSLYSEKLKQSNMAKDKFMSIIAHDLKAPFNSLLGIGELINEEISAGNSLLVEEYSKIMYKTISQTYNLLNNLLEWSRSQTGGIEFKPELNLLAQSVNSIVELLNQQAVNKHITVRSKVVHSTLVFGDRNMIETILRNLVSNAIKYSEAGSEITVRAEKNENGITISVSDTGVGISTEKMDRLFQFENSKSTPGTANEKGTGLGLILCKEFIERHGGKIWVESEKGKGTTFFFNLPEQSQ